MIKIISTNKQAYHDYEILNKIQVGICLLGSEVKTCRENNGVTLKGSYITIFKNQLFLLNCNISKYSNAAGYFSHEPLRQRKLLAHKKEIIKLNQQIKEKSLTIIPLQIYFDNNLVKLDIALAKGKHNYDKRESLKNKQMNLDMKRGKNYVK